MENGERSLFRIPLDKVGGLTDEQEAVVNKVMQGSDIFITGGGGTGKTYVLKKVYQLFRERGFSVAVVAYTAQAALEAGGVTINRFFGFPAEVCITRGEKPKPLQRANEYLKRTDVLIIDEISMVRSDMMDSILLSVKKVEKIRGNRIQIVLFGDFYQIPPVPAINVEDRRLLDEYYEDSYRYRYAFMAKYWKSRAFQVAELKNVVRQEETDFIDNLNKLRVGDSSAVNWFNNHASFEKDKNAPNFFTLNENVMDENLDALNRLKGDLATIRPISTKLDPDPSDESLLVQMTLYLKVGARVMATKNYVAPGVVNGMTGTVKKISRTSNNIERLGYKVTVKFDKLHNEVDIEPIAYTMTHYETSSNGINPVEEVFYQLPLQLAYAMTIHKGQGKTCDAANITPYSKVPGQLYVALSRVREISGLHLTKEVKPEYVLTSPEVKEYMEHCNEAGYVFSWEKTNEGQQRGRKVEFSCGLKRTYIPTDILPLVRMVVKSYSNGTPVHELESSITNVLVELNDKYTKPDS